jgi:transcription elongation factor SPT6
LWNNTRDLCNIVFHPLQSVVPVEYVQRSFERVLVQVTALVGVDINNAVKHTHLRGTLQFVPGLGPRKAKALLEGIRSSGGVVATRMIDLRKFLVGNSETTTVWTNAIAYLRITAHHFGKDAERRGPLDDTRIHPNDFRFAVKVAQDALDRAEDVQMTEDLDELEAKRVEVLREVMGGNDDGPNPHIDDIIRVDVPGMAEAWRENYGENKARVLAALKDEMLAPFAEKRAEFKELKDSDAFFICVEAEPSEFVEGRLFDCVVRDVNRSMVRVEILDEELSGVIMHDSLSDSAKPCSELVKRGDSVQARLLKVDFSRWNLVLSSKGSDLLNLEKYENVRELESSCPYLRWTLAENERISARVEKKRLELERQMRSEIAKRSLMRVVDHPSFKNFGLDETLQALKDAPIGEAIFRPSSKGLDFLTLSYKGLPDLIVHVAILEKDKPHAAALGRRLEVQGVGEFEDLDELLARYVNPMVDGMAEVAAHHRFTPGDMAQVELLLRVGVLFFGFLFCLFVCLFLSMLVSSKEDKATHPNENVYRLAVDQVNVGYFKIVYISTERLHEQPFSVRPGGFRLRKRDFKSLKDMIAWFKRHASDPPGKSKPAASQGKK